MSSAVAVELSLLFVAGIFAGLIAGLFGVGGGLIVVPTVYHILLHKGVSPELAIAISVATSLVSIVPTSLSSLRAHQRLGNVRWDILRSWALPLMVGVAIGGLCVSFLRSKVFVFFFAILMLSLALFKTFYIHRLPSNIPLPNRFWAFIYASLIGFLSTLAGIGGGSLTVPVLRIHSVAIKQAIGTSAGFGMVIALVATVTVLSSGRTSTESPDNVFGIIYWPALVALLPATVLVAPLGAKLASRLNDALLSKMFALLLFVLGVRMLLSVVE